MVDEVADEVGDPTDLQLDLRRVRREHAGAAGPDADEEVRVALGADAEVRAGPVGPVVAQEATVATAHVDARERAGHRVEPGGEHEHVELDEAAARCGCPSG